MHEHSDAAETALAISSPSGFSDTTSAVPPMRSAIYLANAGVSLTLLETRLARIGSQPVKNGL